MIMIYATKQFDAERIKPAESEFDGKKVRRFQYAVTDPNTSQMTDKLTLSLSVPSIT
jgi:hypothetical protein